MSALTMTLDGHRDRLGLKGPRAAEWLLAQGMVSPSAPNTWTYSDETPGAGGAVLVARLGAAEFFLEEGAGGSEIRRISPSSRIGSAPGVYPMLREDWAFDLRGEGVHDVLTQVCNVNFAALALEPRPLIMTMMIGVAVLVVPQIAAGGRDYRIWCDPTFGPYLGESLGAVVSECGGECGGNYTGASA